MAYDDSGRPVDVRARILVEATRLFGEQGYEGTSIQEVADAVGVRKPSLLYHFTSKLELHGAVIDALLARWKDVIPSLLAASRSGHDRYSAAIMALVEFLQEDPNRAKLAVRELMDRPVEARDRIAQHISPWLPIVTDYIRMGQSTGVVKKEVDPESYVIHVILMVVGTVAMSGVTSAFADADSPEPLKPMIDEMVRIARDALFVDSE